MSYSSMADLDDAEDRRMRREAARAAVRGTPVDAEPDPEPAPRPVPPSRPAPSPAWMPPRAAAKPDPENEFEVLDELPGGAAGSGRRPPAIRLRAVAAAQRNPGKWLRYPPTDGDPYKNASSIVNQARQGKAGFPAGFGQSIVRDKTAFLRYDPEGATE